MGSIETNTTRRCALVRPGEAAEGRTGVSYAPGIAAESVGASGLCMPLASLPELDALPPLRPEC